MKTIKKQEKKLLLFNCHLMTISSATRLEIRASPGASRVGRTPATQAYDKMDLRGVEPLSESLAIATSPITVYLYAFAVPSGSADKRASTFSSFIIRPCGQSFPRVVSYVIDARVRTRRCALSDSCH